jgi:hypothetical protein
MFIAALGTQHAMCTPHIVICGCQALKYFSTLSHKKHYFQKKIIAHKRVSILSANFVSNISHDKKNSMTYYHKCV